MQGVIDDLTTSRNHFKVEAQRLSSELAALQAQVAAERLAFGEGAVAAEQQVEQWKAQIADQQRKNSNALSLPELFPHPVRKPLNDVLRHTAHDRVSAFVSGVGRGLLRMMKHQNIPASFVRARVHVNFTGRAAESAVRPFQFSRVHDIMCDHGGAVCSVHALKHFKDPAKLLLQGEDGTRVLDIQLRQLYVGDHNMVSIEAWDKLSALADHTLMSGGVRKLTKKFVNEHITEMLDLRTVAEGPALADRSSVEVDWRKTTDFLLLGGILQLDPEYTENSGNTPLEGHWTNRLRVRRATPLSRTELAFVTTPGLRALCEANKLSVSGSRGELRTRLLQQAVFPYVLSAEDVTALQQACTHDAELRTQFANLPVLKVVIQGDGFLLGKKNKLSQLHFFVHNEGRHVLSVEHRFPLAIMTGGESYDAYSKLRLWQSIEQNHGGLYVHPTTGELFRLEFVLSGDWMFLSAITGIAPPNSRYFCLWCHCTKNEIANLHKAHPIERSTATCKDCLAKVMQVPAGYISAKELTAQHLKDKNRYDIFSVEILQSAARERFVTQAEMTAKLTAAPRQAALKKFLLTDDKTFSRLQQPALLAGLGRMHEQLYIAAGMKSANLGYLRPSLVPTLPAHNVVIDVLHVFLRLFDRVFRCLVADAVEQGKGCLEQFACHMRSVCKVTGWDWMQDPNTKQISWRSLDGKDKLRVLLTLDPVAIFLPFQTAANQVDISRRCRIWKSLSTIYGHLREWKLSCSVDEFETKCRDFITNFVGDTATSKASSMLSPDEEVMTDGYLDACVTPYMHALVCHAPSLMRRHGTLMAFSCFAGEKLNHTEARTYFRSTGMGGGQLYEGAEETSQTRVLKQLLSHMLRVVFNPMRTPLPALICNVHDCTARFSYPAWLHKHQAAKHPHELAAMLESDLEDMVDEEEPEADEEAQEAGEE